MPRQLFFFTHWPVYPLSSGLARRCVELLDSYRAADYEVTLLSAQGGPGFSKWDRVAIDYLEARHVDRVLVYDYTSFDRRFVRWVDRCYQRLGRERPLNSIWYTPPGLRRWFRKNIYRLKPEVVVIVYAMWDGLRKAIPSKMHVRTIMETIDLTSVNQKMWRALEKRLPPYVSEVGDEVLREDFFEKLQLQPDNREFEIYDRYGDTIAISQAEADLLSKRTKRTRVQFVPMTLPAVDCRNTYSSAAVFPAGPNPFNLQASYYLTNKVVPEARAFLPDFEVKITGPCTYLPKNVPGVTLADFVPDLTSTYAEAAFLICPMIGGTGQIVKVIEAMAHGVAPVVLYVARDRVPIRHGEDGFIARDYKEFLSYAIELWRDRALCRRIGTAARERIRRDFSPEHLRIQVRDMLRA